ncbi:hypothetical protein [Marinicellulosiphila megalodicopiae]|uniref:hypothetical protein n=1 Tax=Marinicellulosiphila megalodicopiae TaxID=2724896 RepID=UPI003BB0B315
MKKLLYVLIFALILISAICANLFLNQNSESRVDVHYLGMNFSVPSNHMLIGLIQGGNDLLVLKYGDELSKQYIGFTNESKPSGIDYQCELQEFYHDVFTEAVNSNCNAEEMGAFKKVFLSNNEFGQWKNNDFISYYISGDKGVFLFVILKEKVIRINSDYLALQELKEIVLQHL